MDTIVNRVANSSLVSVDLDEYLDLSPVMGFDIKEGLFQGILLKEREFRAFLKQYDWQSFSGKNVHVFCSTDALIPSWAWMLVASKLQAVANIYTIGEEDDLEKAMIDQAIARLLHEVQIKDAKLVIKGCGGLKNRDYAYFRLAQTVLPLVSSLMYGEPCSTVPVYKKLQ